MQEYLSDTSSCIHKQPASFKVNEETLQAHAEKLLKCDWHLKRKGVNRIAWPRAETQQG